MQPRSLHSVFSRAWIIILKIIVISVVVVGIPRMAGCNLFPLT